jgi:Domain of unknown function (DUF1996)
VTSTTPRTVLILSVVALFATVGVGLAVALSREPAEAERVEGMGPQGRVPQFKVECAWSHSAPDDPIVHPNHPGRSHLHDFFGSTETDADSVAEDLLGSETSCQNQLDTAAYWAPAVMRDGEAVTPSGSVAYYRPGPGADPAAVEAFPAGLMMVAGDQTATSAQDLEVAAWHCGASPVLSPEPPTCPRTAPLGVRIAFPDCWDGDHLDSDDHRAHVARSRDGRCPIGHPVAIPQLVFEVHYPLTGEPSPLELASGGVHGVHADFLNAWDQEALEREVRVCLNGEHVCGVVSNRGAG